MSKGFINPGDFDKLGKTLNKLPKKHFNPKNRESVLAAGAKPIQRSIKARAPVGVNEKHSTKDGVKKKGTLQESVQIFKSRRDKKGNAVLVGNVLNKNSKISSVQNAPRVSKGRNRRAYYANILLAIKKGSFRPRGGKTTVTAYDFIQEGYAAAKGTAARNIIREGEKIIKEFKRKYSF